MSTLLCGIHLEFRGLELLEQLMRTEVGQATILQQNADPSRHKPRHGRVDGGPHREPYRVMVRYLKHDLIYQTNK